MEEYPQCPICLDIYGNYEAHIRAPKIIKCGDSICKECLEKMINNSKQDYFLCPECKEKVKKEKNIDDYITNKDFIKIIDSCFIISSKINNNNLSEDNFIEYNIILLGNAGVGKTSIFNRLSKDIFSERHLATVGCDTNIYYIKYKGNNYRIKFNDPSGEERYKCLAKNFLRHIDGVLFIFDLINKRSFYELQSWYDLYKEENEIVVGLLIGNKCDYEYKAINEEEAIKFAKKNGLKKYIETSAKLDKKIKKAVACLLEQIINSKKFDNNSNSGDRYFQLQKVKLKNEKNCTC